MNRRRAARFGAVQALYQAEMAGGGIEQVIAEFQAHRLADLLEPLELDGPSPQVDRAWFKAVTEGAWQQAPELDPAIGATLAAGWSLDRLGYLLRAFLRAGAYELASRPEVPVKVVIHEYVELAHAFLSPDDAGFVNAVLDRLAGRLRPEGEAPSPPPAPAGAGA
jgi:N utilization substance protein B